jgi:putative heme-binding domain-containing protein
VDTAVLQTLLKPAVQHLLLSNEKGDQIAGLQAAESYRISALEAEVIRLAEGEDMGVVRMALNALQRYSSAASSAAFAKMFEDHTSPFELRLAALHALVKQPSSPNANQLQRFLTSLSDFEEYEFTSALSSSKPGGEFLLSLLEANQLKEDALDDATLVRLLNLDLQSARLRSLKLARDQGRQASFEKRFGTFLTIARSGSGDPAKGRSTFAVLCLSCHRVGTEGVGFAPALDGSGYRDDEALLTAILNPDAAVERAYQVSRILKNDGTTVEGFVEKHDDRGVTLRFMGGAALFVSSADVKAVQILEGRSVMPTGLIDHLPAADVADLLAYIRTLK